MVKPHLLHLLSIKIRFVTFVAFAPRSNEDTKLGLMLKLIVSTIASVLELRIEVFVLDISANRKATVYGFLQAREHQESMLVVVLNT